MKGKKTAIGLLFFVLLASFVVSIQPGPALAAAAAAEEETIAGTVTKTDRGIVIEAEDGDYLVKGQDLSKMIGKMVEATGIITESEKGDTIEVKSFEEIQE
ncbi:MAG: hypothetical protein LLF99_10045 [Desulfobacteraceae bacterium]|nr:hypothetical protein [Desulfobacteraceae bacterium]